MVDFLLLCQFAGGYLKDGETRYHPPTLVFGCLELVLEPLWVDILPKTNKKSHMINGLLEDDPASSWGARGLFSGANRLPCGKLT